MILYICIKNIKIILDWSLNNDTSKMDINVESDKIEFSDDTVHLYSNVSLTNLTVNTINGTNINELFSELFIIHENQKIKGRLFRIILVEVV